MAEEIFRGHDGGGRVLGVSWTNVIQLLSGRCRGAGGMGP